MPYQTIEVTKLTPHIGAEIGGATYRARSATSNSRKCTTR
jgi:hypothetical protein